MSKPLNVGLIGCGFMGRTHSNAYRKVYNFFRTPLRPVLKAICDVNADKAKTFADTWGYESVETDWRKLLDRKDIELVDICVQNNMHKEIAIAAAKALLALFAAALVVEMLARTRKKISELLQQVYAITGRLYAEEDGVQATPEMRIVIPRRIKALAQEHQITPVQLGPYPVVSISELDGTKFLLENDNWALLRFSGTEPVLRVYAEGRTQAVVQAMMEYGESIAKSIV